MTSLFFVGLPSADEIRECPDRAIIAALDASLVLAVRVLAAQHAGLAHDPADVPLLMLNESLQSCATSLHSMLLTYDDLTSRMAAADRLASSDEAF